MYIKKYAIYIQGCCKEYVIEAIVSPHDCIESDFLLTMLFGSVNIRSLWHSSTKQLSVQNRLRF